ncbi:hypothetical protein KP509_21G024300 [Ceratopteris richardii]|uniref:Uncharacterized protein n=1 Tax=Ceratopteris richardii TaxID=49495 RepID=A0A8T2SBM3_CERRI|nr:hypothetical protein KP509_21G024300 [Ceratopteris richardii]
MFLLENFSWNTLKRATTELEKLGLLPSPPMGDHLPFTPLSTQGDHPFPSTPIHHMWDHLPFNPLHPWTTTFLSLPSPPKAQSPPLIAAMPKAVSSMVNLCKTILQFTYARPNKREN